MLAALLLNPVPEPKVIRPPGGGEFVEQKKKPKPPTPKLEPEVERAIKKKKQEGIDEALEAFRELLLALDRDDEEALLLILAALEQDDMRGNVGVTMIAVPTSG